MGQVTDLKSQSEYWHPVLDPRRPGPAPTRAPYGTGETCAHCATEFVMGSRFCHACGEPRPGQPPEPVNASDARLSVGSALALIVGVLCLLAAIGTGIVFSVETVLDWEAVQSWRVQWLLAAVAAFAAGILLKPVGAR